MTAAQVVLKITEFLRKGPSSRRKHTAESKSALLPTVSTTEPRQAFFQASTVSYSLGFTKLDDLSLRQQKVEVGASETAIRWRYKGTSDGGFLLPLRGQFAAKRRRGQSSKNSVLVHDDSVGRIRQAYFHS
mmetsp:Transcript_7417/g.14511  ORF Transcript_7417/g.14511 Transcript_7417/m.14511 type:complete len:131 (+) Transcript_7417:254-646(+)